MQDIYFERPSDYLEFEFKLRLQRRPAYSLRAFARDLQISPASLTGFLHNRQGMSFERVSSIAKLLNWDDQRKEHLWDLIQSRYSRDEGARKAALIRAHARIKRTPTRIRADVFKMMSDWYHLAVLELVRIRPDFGEVTLVAEQLNLPKSVAKETLDRLTRIGLLEVTESGWRAHNDTSHAGDEVPSEAVRSFHHQILGLSQEGLHKHGPEDRESLSVIFSGRQEDLPSLRREARDAVLSVVARFAKGDPADTIQAITVQINPIWKAPRPRKESK